MVPKFVPVRDLNNNSVYPGASIKGVQHKHTDWGTLYKDPSVGDSLANVVRHWNGECVIDIPFLIIGGSQSIAAVLEHDSNVRLVSAQHFADGIVSFVNKETKAFGKDYTCVMVIPSILFSHARATPIENLGNLRMQVNKSKLDTKTPAESLNSFRSNWNRFDFIYQRYVDI
jgi:hypothetical protein